MTDDFFSNLEDLELSFENDDDLTYQCNTRHIQGAYGEFIPIQTNLFYYDD